MKANKACIQIVIEKTQYEQIKAIADAQHRSVSSMGKIIIDEFLERTNNNK